MLQFEINLFFPVEYKTDSIKLDDVTTIHYKISTDRQNSKWFIAVTLVKNGKVIIRNDLSRHTKLPKESYTTILAYIQLLPHLIKEVDIQLTHTDKMKDELDKLIYTFEHNIMLMKDFRDKYCGKEKD